MVVVSSCSPSIYAGGRHSDVLTQGKFRAEIRSALGQPIKSGRAAGEVARIFPGATYDEFQVKGSVYDRHLTTGAAMGTVMTFGLLELVSFPSAVWWKLSSRGLHDVTVSYSSDGMYSWHHVTKSLPRTIQREQDIALDR